jgi:CRP-like cAMP-binding protein
MTLPSRLRLEQLAELSTQDRQVLAGAVSHTVTLDPNKDLIRQDERPTQCYLVLEGILCRYKLPRTGKRLIIGFHISGDFCDLNGPIMGRMDHSVASLTPAKLAVIPRAALVRLIERRPQLGQALWKETIADAAIAREWVANVGSRPAYHRVAHLLCEMGCRLQAAGLARDGEFEWQITDAEVADAMGLSIVHVSRVFQQLREEGLLAKEGSTIRVLDWQQLEAAGEFSPNYLFLAAGNRQEHRASP